MILWDVLTIENSERDCKGSNWRQVGSAFTVPDFLKNHIWSFHNQC